MTTNNKTNTKVEPTEFEIEVVALLNQLAKGETDVYKAGKAFMRLNRVYHTKNEQPTNTERTVDEVALKEFYSTEGIPDEMKQPISFMRQWLNEDRKATPMVTARDLWHWISPIILAERQRAEGEKQSIIKEILEVIPKTVLYGTGDQKFMTDAVKAIATRNNIQV